MSNLNAAIDAIAWSEFSTAYGSAGNVPRLLKDLASSDSKKAKNASHDLWCGLCHQHAYVSSAALPSYPILMKVMKISDEELTIEILDILLGFASCTSMDFWPQPVGRPSWATDLRERMSADIDVYASLTNSETEEVRNFATWICDALNP